MTPLLIAAACYLLPSALIGLWILADRWLDARHDAENVDALPDADAEWLAVLAATEERRPSDLSPAVPIYDAISREFAKRELTDDALADLMERWS